MFSEAKERQTKTPGGCLGGATVRQSPFTKSNNRAMADFAGVLFKPLLPCYQFDFQFDYGAQLTLHFLEGKAYPDVEPLSLRMINARR